MQRITRNGSDVQIGYRRTAVGQKAVEFDPDEYQKFKYHRYVQKPYTIPNLSNRKFDLRQFLQNVKQFDLFEKYVN